MIGWATVWLITSFVADQDSSTLLDLTAPTVLPLLCVLSFHCTVSFVLDFFVQSIFFVKSSYLCSGILFCPLERKKITFLCC
jgi:hypothetical protein